MTQDFTNKKLAAKSAPIVSSRRAVLMKGLAAAPLIATVASRPAWAVADKCSISGNLSGNISNADTEIEICLTERKGYGRSPGWWVNWGEVYKFILTCPTLHQFRTTQNGDRGPFRGHPQRGTLHQLGDGDPLMVLYQWYRALNAPPFPSPSVPGDLGINTLAPTEPSGTVAANISEVGEELLKGTGAGPIGELYAAILSTLLPNGNFPLPGLTPWTDTYIVQNWLDNTTTNVRGETPHSILKDLLSQFFLGDHPEPPNEPFFVHNPTDAQDPEAAYLWAREFLFGVPPT